MGYAANVYKVMIASPSDVAAERGVIRELIHRWNNAHSDTRKIVLVPVGWETHSTPEMGDRPQAILNKQILGDCDLLIGVFWTRIGTSTGEYASGTVEEIEEHIKAGKPAMIYFSSAPVVPESIDPTQYGQLINFKNSCRERGIYEGFSDVLDFRNKLDAHLQIKLNKDTFFKSFGETQQSNQNEIPELKPRQVLSQEAKLLLSKARADGQILRLQVLGGLIVQANGENLAADASPREVANWESAINELEKLGYVESANSKREVLRLTRDGYEMADLISI